jgi:hypothetical protein
LHGAGFEEKAVAILRGFFDFNLGPAFDHATYPHRLDTKQLEYMYCTQAEPDPADLLEGTWLELEAKQVARFWCPRGLNPSPLDPEEDFNREVLWEDIASFVYWSPHAQATQFFKLVFCIFGLIDPDTDPDPDTDDEDEDVFARPHEDVTWRLSKVVALPKFMLPSRDYPRLSPSKAEFILSMLMQILPVIDDFGLAEAAFALFAQYHPDDWRVRLPKVLSQHPGRAALWWAWCRLAGDVRAWKVLVERFVDRGLRARFALGAAQSLLRQADLAGLRELLPLFLGSQSGDEGTDQNWAALREVSEYLTTGSVDPARSPSALGLYQCHLFLHPAVPLDVPLYRRALLQHLEQAPADRWLLVALSKLDPAPASFNSPLVRWISDHPSASSLKLLLRLSLPRGNVNRVRALFERLLKATNDAALWEGYLRYLHRQDSPAALQSLLYRALQRSPSSKALYMAGIELVPSSREELYALAEEKGIRLRCLLEEATR